MNKSIIQNGYNLYELRTSEYHVLVLNLTDKLDLRRDKKTVSIYYTWKNIKSSYNNNKF